MIASRPASLFYRFLSVYMTGLRKVTVSSDTMRELGMICQGEIPEKTIVQVKPETKNNKNARLTSENMSEKLDFEGENIENDDKNMRFPPYYGHISGFFEPFTHFYHLHPFPSRFRQNTTFSTFYGGEPTHHPDHVRRVHCVKDTWSAKKVRETQRCAFSESARTKFFNHQNHAKRAYGHGFNDKNLLKNAHNRINFTHFTFIFKTFKYTFIILETHINAAPTTKPDNLSRKRPNRTIQRTDNFGKFSADFQHFLKIFQKHFQHISTYFNTFFSYFHLLSPHSHTFPTNSPHFPNNSITQPHFLPAFSPLPFYFIATHSRPNLSSPRTETQRTYPTATPSETTFTLQTLAETQYQFLGKFFTFFQHFSTFFSLFFQHFFNIFFNIPALFPTFFQNFLYFFSANRTPETNTQHDNPEPNSTNQIADIFPTGLAKQSQNLSKYTKFSNFFLYISAFFRIFLHISAHFHIYFQFFTLFRQFSLFLQFFPTFLNFSHFFSTICFFSSETPPNPTHDTSKPQSQQPPTKQTKTDNNKRMAQQPKMARYAELTSAAAEDPTLGSTAAGATQLYIVLGHHNRSNVENCLTIRHKIAKEHIVHIGPTTIGGSPAVEIYLQANGLGVAALKSKKFHDTSNRYFLTEEDLAKEQQQGNEDVAVMILRVPFKLSTSKKALRDIVEAGIPNLKFKDIVSVQTVNDDEGKFASKVRIMYKKQDVNDVINENGQRDDKNWKLCQVGFVLTNTGRVVVPDFTNSLNNRSKPFYQVDVQIMTDEFVFLRELHAENNVRTVGVLPASKANKRRKCVKCALVLKIDAYCERRLCPTICPRCNSKCENVGHCEKMQRSRKRTHQSNPDQENWKQKWAAEADKEIYSYIKKCIKNQNSFITVIPEFSIFFTGFFLIYPSRRNHQVRSHQTSSAHQTQPNTQPTQQFCLHQTHQSHRHLTKTKKFRNAPAHSVSSSTNHSISSVSPKNYRILFQRVRLAKPSNAKVWLNPSKNPRKNQKTLKKSSQIFVLLYYRLIYYRHEKQAPPYHRFS